MKYGWRHQSDDKEKIWFRTDPKSDALRKLNMYSETASLVVKTESHLPVGRARRALLRDKKAELAAVTVEMGKPNPQDEALRWANCIVRIRDAKDRKAFADLFQHFAPRVKAFLMRSGADVTMAEECTQEVMAAVWQKAHLYDPARASAATWIFTIARNRKIDAIRKIRRPEPEDLTWGPEEEPDQADTLALQQETQALGEALASLPEKQRELIEKAYFGDLSHSEIAAETGLPLGTIKSRIRLALDRLRHKLK